MPRQPYTWRRWNVTLAWAMMAVGCVLGLFALTQSYKATDRVARDAKVQAHRADELGLENRRQRKALVRQRTKQVRQLHQLAAESCRSRHLIDSAFQDVIARSLAQTRTTRIPDLTPAQKRVLDHQRAATIRLFVHDLRRLRAADCRSVPPLPPAR